MMIEISPKSTDNRKHKSSTSLSSSLFKYSRSERKLDAAGKSTYSTSDIVNHKLRKAESRCSEFKEKLDFVKNLKKGKKKRRTGSLTHMTRVLELTANKDLTLRKSSGHKVHALTKKDKSNVSQIPETKKNATNRKQPINLTSSKTRMRKASESAGAAYPASRRKYVDPDELQQHAMVRQMQDRAPGEVMPTDPPEPRIVRPKKIRPPKKITRYTAHMKDHDDIKEEDQPEKHHREFSQRNASNKETLKSGRKLARSPKSALASAAHAAKQDQLEEALFNEGVSLLDTTHQGFGGSFDDQQLHDEPQHSPIVELYHNKASNSCKATREQRSMGHSTEAQHSCRGRRFEAKARREHSESKYQTDRRFEKKNVKSKKNSEKYNTTQVYNLETDLTEAEGEIFPSNDMGIPILPLKKKYRRNQWNFWPRNSAPGKFAFSSLLAPQARRYELPTIASKMKQVDNRMLMRKSDIPFVPAKSTSPSHNIGMNLQKLMADIKINNSVTGIPLSLALRMGLKLGQLKARSKRKYHRLMATQQRVGEMGALRVGARSVPLQRTMSFGRLLRLCGDGDGVVPRYLRGQGRANCFHSSFTLSQELDSTWARYTEKSEPVVDEMVTVPNSEQYDELREVEQLGGTQNKKLVRKTSKEFGRRHAMRQAEDYISKMKDVGAYVASNTLNQHSGNNYGPADGDAHI